MFEELRANPRLRMGLALALALVLFVVLNDWRAARGAVRRLDEPRNGRGQGQ